MGRRTVIAVGLMVLACSATALADSVTYNSLVAPEFFQNDGDGDDNTFRGLRSTDDSPGGLTGSYTWESGFDLEFLITYDPNSAIYTYRYTFTGSGLGSNAISHFTLDVTDDLDGSNAGFAFNPATDTNSGGDGDGFYPLEWDDNDGIEGAVKFDFGAASGADSLYYEFDIRRRPMWGDIYLKDGQGGGLEVLTNDNFGQASGPSIGYVPVPDSGGGPPQSIIPVPAAAWMGLTCLGGLFLMQRRRRSRS